MNNFSASCLSGLVDAHTHPVWAGDRVHEFAMKVSFFSVLTFDPYFSGTSGCFKELTILVERYDIVSRSENI